MSKQRFTPMTYQPTAKYSRSCAPQPAAPFVPHVAKTTVTIPGGIPTIEIADRAYHDMLYMVDIVPVEVGWLGTVTVIGNVYRIEEVFIFDQEVHGSQCELSADGIAEWATRELLVHENGIDLMNCLRFWGHSHGMMGTTPSGQDDSQVEEFRADCDFFIRGIFNKKGEARFDVYRFNLNLTFLDVSWKRAFTEDRGRRSEVEECVRKRVHEQAYSYPSLSHKNVASPQFEGWNTHAPWQSMERGNTIEDIGASDAALLRQTYDDGFLDDLEDTRHD